MATTSVAVIATSITDLKTASGTNPIAIVTDINNGGVFYFYATTSPTSPFPDDPTNPGSVYRNDIHTGYWIRDLRRTIMISPRWFGTQGDNSTDDTPYLNAAFKFAATYGYIIVTDNATYKVTGTITPNGTFTWIANNTIFNFYVSKDSSGNFIYSGTGLFTSITDSAAVTKYVAFDTLNCQNSYISGVITFKVNGTQGNMTTAKRGGNASATGSNLVIPPYLAAWSASAKGNNGK